MFKFFLVAALIACVAADGESHGDESHAETTLWKSDVRPDGFDSAAETTNHISQHASGNEHGDIEGAFGWIDPKGEHIDITYKADENGYQPQGAAIPTPHPIPEYILKAIAYINAHPSKVESHH